MRINCVNGGGNAVQSSGSTPNFKALITEKSALPIIDSMSKNDILEFNKIKDRMSKTKYWDLIISGIGNSFKEFKFEFRNKSNKYGVITDGIHPYTKQGDTINIYSIVYDIKNTSHNVLKTLKFKSKEAADEIYDAYMRHVEFIRSRQFNLTPLERLKGKEIEMNMLETSIPEDNHTLVSVLTDIKNKTTVGNGLDLKTKG